MSLPTIADRLEAAYDLLDKKNAEIVKLTTDIAAANQRAEDADARRIAAEESLAKVKADVAAAKAAPTPAPALGLTGIARAIAAAKAPTAAKVTPAPKPMQAAPAQAKVNHADILATADRSKLTGLELAQAAALAEARHNQTKK